jgi:hypothetical protein
LQKRAFFEKYQSKTGSAGKKMEEEVQAGPHGFSYSCRITIP